MKRAILYSLLLSYSAVTCAQSNVKLVKKKSQDAKVDERWNLDKYIWSRILDLSSQKNKPLLDFNAIDNWEHLPVHFSTIPNLSISQDGQYIAYGISTTRLGNADKLVLQSTKEEWLHTFSGASLGFFSADTKQYIFQDTAGLCFVRLGSDQRSYIRNVISYRSSLPFRSKTTENNVWIAWQLKNMEVVLLNLLTGKENHFGEVVGYSFDMSGNWLVCQTNTKDLIIYNLNSDQEFRYSSVVAYNFNDAGNALLLKKANQTINQGKGLLSYVDLVDGKEISILEENDNYTVSNFQLDASGKQVVFAVCDKSKQYSIWYWKKGMEKAIQELNNQSAVFEHKLMIQEIVYFTVNGQYIQFFVTPKTEQHVIDSDAVKVDIWNYKDTILQSNQPILLKGPLKYTAVLCLATGKVMQLENENERLVSNVINYDYVIVQRSSFNDRFWEKNYDEHPTVVISLKDGKRRELTSKAGRYGMNFSPNGNYFVYFNEDQHGNYYSFNLKSGELINISAKAPIGQFAHTNEYLRSKKKLRAQIINGQMIGWLEEKGLLVTDDYDIWQLNVEGKMPPVNLTNGYGRLHRTKFQISGYENIGIYRNTDTLLLKAFNLRNKFNGYYRKVLSKLGDPEQLYMGPCFIENVAGIGGAGMVPQKAGAANVWIVQRQTASDAPNYFMTTDFKEYKQLSRLQPQRNYNWLTAELHSFKQLDGTVGHGILYKPENFDSTKKYPVIVTFYEGELSGQLNQYLLPGYITKASVFSQPAWMVSHGYLVFVPDIYIIEGNWGLGTINSIEGAVRYLKQLKYVDGQHLGAAGHSNSGNLGYYLLTHSHSFAAMAIGAGTTNVINSALSVGANLTGKGGLIWVERQAHGTGLGNLWQHKAIWLDHTAVLNADKVTSPLLLFHCKNDGAPVLQAVQMFTALRRLEKRAWWFQYDEGSHVLGKLRDMRDFTIRYTQFFDHFLKSAPAPRWMTQGISTAMKGIETGYELDPKGSCAIMGKNKCDVCHKWNDIYRKNRDYFGLW